MNVGEDKCLQGFGGETCEKKTFGRPKRRGCILSKLDGKEFIIVSG
jgi:hypothetical protein